MDEHRNPLDTMTSDTGFWKTPWLLFLCREITYH